MTVCLAKVFPGFMINKCDNAQTSDKVQHKVRGKIMKKSTANFLMLIAIAVAFVAAPAVSLAQNSNSSTGQMKESGSEVKRAGTSGAHYVKHGRMVRGGKHFGRHMGRAGRHFGRGTKKAVKHVIS
jgi:hypothetical protein